MTPATAAIPPLLHRLRVLITRTVRASTPATSATHYTLLRHILARPSPALPYALLLTSLFFLRESRRDLLRGNVWKRRAEVAEWCAARVVRCCGGGIGWRGVVEALTYDFSPRQRGMRRHRLPDSTSAPVRSDRRSQYGNGEEAGASSLRREPVLNKSTSHGQLSTTASRLRAPSSVSQYQANTGSNASTFQSATSRLIVAQAGSTLSSSDTDMQAPYAHIMSPSASDIEQVNSVRASWSHDDDGSLDPLLAPHSALSTPRAPSFISDAATAATSVRGRPLPRRPGSATGESIAATEDYGTYSEAMSENGDDAASFLLSDGPTSAPLGTAAENDDDRMNALEIAVLARSRIFCSDPVVSAVVDACWDGRISFYVTAVDGASSVNTSPNGTTSIVHIHGGGRAMGEDPPSTWQELWRVSRLRSPRVAHVLSMLSYAGFLMLFVQVLLHRQRSLDMSVSQIWAEFFLVLWTIAYIADTASRIYRSGWRFYIHHLISPLDLASQGLLLGFAAIRLRAYIRPLLPDGLLLTWFRPKPTPAQEDAEMLTRAAYDILALAAFPLFTRFGTMMDKWRWAGRPQAVLRRVMRQVWWPLVGFWPLAVLGVAFALRGLELGKDRVAISAASGSYNPRDPWDGVPDQPFVRILYILSRAAVGAVDSAFASAPSFHPVLGPALFLAFMSLLVMLPLALCFAVVLDTYRETAVDDHRALARYRYEFTLQVLEQARSEPLFPLPPPLNLLSPVLHMFERIAGSTRHACLCRALLRCLFWPVLVVSLVWERAESNTRRALILGPNGFGSGAGSYIGASVFGQGLARVEDVLASAGCEADNDAVVVAPDEKKKLEREVKDLREAMSRLEKALARAIPSTNGMSHENSSQTRLPGGM